MKKQLAIVLSGGGARGALEAGALRALYEAGFTPDLMTGTSIGAANAAFIAVHGFNLASLDRLDRLWLSFMDQGGPLASPLWWQIMRALIGRVDARTQNRIRDFAISNDLTPELRFRDLLLPVYFLAADINAGAPIVFGENPDDLVLDSVLASMTLPPWMSPAERGKSFVIDGGLVSNLPIETAIQQGATEIIALDLLRVTPGELDENSGIGSMLMRLNHTLEARQIRLEIELAEARGIPVRYICLTCDNPPPFWDFRHSDKMIAHGYQVTREEIAKWPHEKPHWWNRIPIKEMTAGFLEVME